MTASEKQMLNNSLHEAMQALLEAQSAIRNALWTLNSAEQETETQEQNGTE
jgi:hypothetical protein